MRRAGASLRPTCDSELSLTGGSKEDQSSAQHADLTGEILKKLPRRKNCGAIFYCMKISKSNFELEAHAGAPCVELVLEFVDNNVYTGSIEGLEERGQGGLGISKAADQGA